MHSYIYVQQLVYVTRQRDAKPWWNCISWCPSHVNIPGNELADKLAEKALSKAPSDGWVSFSYVKRTAKATTLELWKKHWESWAEVDYTGLGRLYRQISRYSLRFHTKVNLIFNLAGLLIFSSKQV